MNNRGFTLVELLATIIILGVIVAISVPTVGNTIKNSKIKSLNITIRNIEDATLKYLTSFDSKYDTAINKIEISELQKSGLIDNSIKNPVTDREIEGCVTYRWSNSSNKYEIKYEESCEFNTLISKLKKTYIEGNTNKGLIKDVSNPNKYYYRGNNNEVSNNYLWYGGHQWRILEFDTNNNTIKLISQQPLTAITPYNKVWTTFTEYDNSFINKWLNDYFYNSLPLAVQENILVSNFNVGIYNNPTEITVNKKIGLLIDEEYNLAGGSVSFLNINDNWWLGNRYDNYDIREVDAIGDLNNGSLNYSLGVRPVITISDIIIDENNGTLIDNFKQKDKGSNTNDVKVGDYIKVPYNGIECGNDKKCVFRVVSKDEDSIKIILNGLLPTLSRFGTNFEIYNKLEIFANNISPKYRYVNPKKFNVGLYNGYNLYSNVDKKYQMLSVGLPVVGEMFSGNDIDLGGEKVFVNVELIENSNISHNWLLNKYDLSNGNVIGEIGNIYYNTLSSDSGVRPCIFLKAGKETVNFVSGDGSPNLPYEIEN